MNIALIDFLENKKTTINVFEKKKSVIGQSIN